MQSTGRSCVHDPEPHSEGPCLLPCPATTILQFVVISEQGLIIFFWQSAPQITLLQSTAIPPLPGTRLLSPLTKSRAAKTPPPLSAPLPLSYTPGPDAGTGCTPNQPQVPGLLATAPETPLPDTGDPARQGRISPRPGQGGRGLSPTS